MLITILGLGVKPKIVIIMAGVPEFAGGIVRRKYPWEEWFEQERVVLLRGVHYACSQSTMVQMVRNNASARGVQVRVTDIDARIVIDVLGRKQLHAEATV